MLLSFLFACGTNDPPSEDDSACNPRSFWADDDGDGFGGSEPTEACDPPDLHWVENGDDCDDHDVAVHPDAAELCNGRDDDCDGEIEADVPTWYADADGDGFGDPSSPASQCEAPDGFVSDASDCDDADGAIHPGVAEVCNASDDDCNEIVDDVDGDGDGDAPLECAGGGDCDDGDALVHPGALDVCGDGVDSDCSGSDVCSDFDGEIDLGASDLLLFPASGNQDYGRAIEVGDIDGDGAADLVGAAQYAASGYGGAYIAFGPLSGTMDAGTLVHGSAGTSYAGRAIGLGDGNDDGFDDLAVGSPYSDEVFVVFGPVTSEVDLSDANVVLFSPGDTFFGHGTALGDVDGDGIDDAIVGAWGASTGGSSSGSIFVEHGPLPEDEIDLVAEADAEIYGDVAELNAGRFVKGGADSNGDGVGDVLAQALGLDTGGSNAGGAFVVHGPFDGLVSLEEADGVLVGEEPNAYAGFAIAQGDVDGDGLADALVGAPYTSDQAGAAYVVLGPSTGSIDLGEADIVIRGSKGGVQVGTAVGAGDANGDGVGEIFVGAIGDETGGSMAGGAFLFYGPSFGEWVDTDAAAHLVGADSTDQAGWAVSVSDLDGDGRGELLVGAPLDETGGSLAGAVHGVFAD